MWVTHWNRIVRVGVTKKGTFNQTLEGDERARHSDIGDEPSQLEETDSMSEDPEVNMGLGYLANSKKAVLWGKQ